MKNPLRTLDELVLAQFEKLTQAAHRRLGWTKYDVRRCFDYTTGVMAAGAGTYSALASISSDRFGPMDLVTSAMAYGLAGLMAKDAKNTWKDEQRELERYVRTGTILRPSSKPDRPFILGTFVPTLTFYAYNCFQKAAVEPSRYMNGL